MEDIYLFYDGTCSFCDRWVRFVLKNEKNDKIRFSHLQSDFASRFLNQSKAKLPMDSVLFFETDELYQKSTAVLRILTFMKWPYKLFLVFWVVPRPIRDFVYDIVAKNRYRILGKQDTKICALPTIEQRSRFLSA